MEMETESHPEPKSTSPRPLPPSEPAKVLQSKKPAWLKIRPPAGETYLEVRSLLRAKKLHTVCEEARCPNVAECWSSGTATFMIGGDICTRACRFCAVKTARRPPPLDPDEPKNIAASIASLGLKYVVLTSVDRDDLADQGAGHFAATIREIKRLDPKILVEALVPDFRGQDAHIHTIVDSGVDVYAHNLETVSRFQYRVRDPRAGYLQSLGVLRQAATYARAQSRIVYTKSSLMLGFGETTEDLREAFADLRSFGTDVLTLGQYLRPSLQHLPVEKFYTPEEFEALADLARTQGFLYVAAGPLVRSSYKAAEYFLKKEIQKHGNGISAPGIG